MSSNQGQAPGAPRRLRCEYLVDPLGLGETSPRLFWQLSDPRRGARQSAYRVMVAGSPELLEAEDPDLWDSGKVRSGRSTHVEYEGAPLTSRQRCWWRVRTWDHEDSPSPWSDVAAWEMGLLERTDWVARWIGRDAELEGVAPTYLRKEFDVPGEVLRARLYATALGVYELHLNAERVGDHVFPPGWTDYGKRVMYQTYDVTDMLAPGTAALGAVVGDGWYCGRLGWSKEQSEERDERRPPRLMLQLEMECADGTVERLVTDGSWTWTAGPILSAGYYHGEHYDARREMPGWSRPGFPAQDWGPVQTFEDQGVELTAQQDPPIRVTNRLRPQETLEPSPGTYVYDMGQNMVGYCRLRVREEPGTEIRVRHAEVLDAEGSLYTENLRTAEATDLYTASGREEEPLVPHFTYHGFRYVELTGLSSALDHGLLQGLVLHTDCPRTGNLITSCEMVNKLFYNILWSQRGNMHSVLTDCPQRDERLGWLGDAQIFTPTACYNMDMAAMLTKFIRDITDEQTPEGAFPDVCPYVSAQGVLPPAGAPGWMDAGVTIPWTVWRFYGDRRILERNFESMAHYVDYLTENNPDGIWENRRGNDYGDWVPAGEQTDKTMFATLQYFRSARLVARIAQLLDRTEEAQKYRAVAERVQEAFNERYLTEDGTYRDATQTVDALALGFGIVPEEHRRAVADDLVANIERRDGHLSTGFSGTRWLLPVLCDTGHAELARSLLLNRDYPSWGYMVEQGATTIWERWNSDTEGPAMNSRNHFAFGSVGEWLYRYLAGIAPAEEGAGFEHVLVRPHPGEADGELSRVRATYESLYGTIEVTWEVGVDEFELMVQVPPNTRATVFIPAESVEQVSEGGRPLPRCEDVKRFEQEGDRVVCTIGAGRYSFTVAR